MTAPGLPVTDSSLHAYADGQLPKARRADVEAYLTRVPEARLRLEAWGRQQAQLRAMLNPVTDEPVPLRLRIDRLDGGAAARTIARRKTALGFMGGFALGVALAGGLFALLGGR